MAQEGREAIQEGYVGLEDGDVFFFYRPLTEPAHGPHDVAALGFVMHPLGQRRYRLINLDTPVLPSEEDAYGFVSGAVENVTAREALIKKRLGETHRQASKDRLITIPAARACAEGVYSFVPHGGHVYFVYLLELPSSPSDVQHRLGIEREGAYLLGVYNPEYFGEEARPESVPRYPPELRRRLGTRRVLFGNTVEFLNKEHTRIGLFARTSEVARQHTADIAPVWEKLSSSDLLQKLRARLGSQPVSPLMGVWS